MYSLYTKPYKNPTDLITKLKSQNLTVLDEPKANIVLSKINYFRFKIYLRPFLDITTKQFRVNSTFEDAYQLYSFDEELKNILFSIISQIEINLRTKLDQYITAYTNNPFWYLDNKYFVNESKIFNTKVSLKNEFLRSKDDFTLHYSDLNPTQTNKIYLFFVILEILYKNQIVDKNIQQEIKILLNKHNNSFSLSSASMDGRKNNYYLSIRFLSLQRKILYF